MANPTATIDILVNSAEAGKQIGRFVSFGLDAFKILGDIVRSEGGTIGGELANIFSGKHVTEALKNYKNVYNQYLDVFDANQIQSFSQELSLVGGTAEEAMGHLARLQDAVEDYNIFGKGILADAGKYIQFDIGEGTNALDLIRQLYEAQSEIDPAYFRQVLKMLGLKTETMAKYFRLSRAEREKNLVIAQKFTGVNEETYHSMEKQAILLNRIKNAVTNDFAERIGSLNDVLEAFTEHFENTSATIRSLEISSIPALAVALYKKGPAMVKWAIGGGIAASPFLASLSAYGLGAMAGGVIEEYTGGALSDAFAKEFGWVLNMFRNTKELEAARERFKNSGWRPKASIFELEDMRDNYGSLGWAVRSNKADAPSRELQKNVLQGAVLNFNIQGVDTNNIPQMRKAITDLIRDQATGKKWGA